MLRIHHNNWRMRFPPAAFAVERAAAAATAATQNAEHYEANKPSKNPDHGAYIHLAALCSVSAAAHHVIC